MKLKELSTFSEMSQQLEMIQFLYPKMTIEKYETYLQEMVPHNYKQLVVLENDVCVGITGFWVGTKLWLGKYLEIDNFVTHPSHRKKGIAKLMTDYLHEKAIELKCTCAVLDAFAGNYEAHRFYYNQGYAPKGFHFIKTFDENGYS